MNFLVWNRLFAEPGKWALKISSCTQPMFFFLMEKSYTHNFKFVFQRSCQLAPIPAVGNSWFLAEELNEPTCMFLLSLGGLTKLFDRFFCSFFKLNIGCISMRMAHKVPEHATT